MWIQVIIISGVSCFQPAHLPLLLNVSEFVSNKFSQFWFIWEYVYFAFIYERLLINIEFMVDFFSFSPLNTASHCILTSIVLGGKPSVSFL